MPPLSNENSLNTFPKKHEQGICGKKFAGSREETAGAEMFRLKDMVAESS